MNRITTISHIQRTIPIDFHMEKENHMNENYVKLLYDSII